MVRVWKFLLPDTGEHTFQVENLGQPGMKVTLDGIAQECRDGQTSFSGPSGSLLRLKQAAKGKTPRGSDATWTLMVNERIVEEMNAKGQGLRDLRSMGEGSYTIATGFSSQGMEDNACRKFQFLIDSDLHEVVVAHKECIWQVALDGALIEQEAHSLNDSEGKVHFEVPNPGGPQIIGILSMSWKMKDFRWEYNLSVGGIPVPASWTKVRGPTTGVPPPSIPSGKLIPASASVPAVAAPSYNTSPPPVPYPSGDKENQCPEFLPQGVSYDREARAFQANIKDPKSNRFIFLGEFATPEAAHEKYKEALARYAPDKRMAPPI